MGLHVDETRLQTLGKYRIEGILGQGSMGVVYKGYDIVIQRFIALKTIHAELLAGEYGREWLARFKREVQAAGRCLHPNIVTVFEYGEELGIPYIAMEYVQGRELKRYLKDHLRFDTKTALHIIIQVLNALEYAHESGVVHRDIKPGNIMLLENNFVKVADFGIARIDASSMTQHGLAIGTPGYMAPEQVLGGLVTRATDIYATGAVLFELLTGQKPFSGRTTTEILKQVVGDNVHPLDPDQRLPPALQPIIHRALAKNSQERFQTAKEFAAALEQAVPEYAVHDNPPAVARLHLFRPSADTSTTLDSGSVWEPAVLRQVEEQLVMYVGPLAKVMVKKAARQATDIRSLYQTLAQCIPTELERTRFLKTAVYPQENTEHIQSSPAAPAREDRFNPQRLEVIVGELAVYVGPIAKVLVNKTAGQAASLEDLYRRLSSHILSEAERTDFLKKIPT